MPRPERVVCLTAETTELAFALGCGDRVVGVTGYAVRPPEARRKPRVAAFRTAHVERILALKPDLVLGFSDLQADIAGELVRAGAQVLVTNQRTLSETALAITIVAGALGEASGGERLAASLLSEIDALASPARAGARRPRVFFEEWDEPLIGGIAWAGEIVERCGGEEIFPELRAGRAAAARVVDPAEVARRDPELILASWCGKKVRPERICSRPGWQSVSAVRNGHVVEIKSPDILAPGLSLVHGARAIAAAVRAVSRPT